MRLKLILSMFFTAMVSINAYAQDGGSGAKGYAGGLFGAHVPDMDDTSMRGAWGLTAGAKLSSELSLGGYYFGSSKEEDMGNVATDFNYSLLGVEASYHFEGSAVGTYLGVRGGITSVELKSVTRNLDTNPYHIGFVVGYNHWITPALSIGGEGAFYSVEKDTDSGVSQSGFNIISLMASAKFWF